MINTRAYHPPPHTHTHTHTHTRTHTRTHKHWFTHTHTHTHTHKPSRTHIRIHTRTRERETERQTDRQRQTGIVCKWHILNTRRSRKRNQQRSHVLWSFKSTVPHEDNDDHVGYGYVTRRADLCSDWWDKHGSTTDVFWPLHGLMRQTAWSAMSMYVKGVLHAYLQCRHSPKTLATRLQTD